jgi:hypothetical protein
MNKELKLEESIITKDNKSKEIIMTINQKRLSTSQSKQIKINALERNQIFLCLVKIYFFFSHYFGVLSK